MGVARSIQVGPRLVDLAVDGKGWAIDGCLRTLGLDLAVLVDEDEIAHADLREVRAERVDPEVFWVEGITEG